MNKYFTVCNFHILMKFRSELIYNEKIVFMNNLFLLLRKLASDVYSIFKKPAVFSATPFDF